MAQQSQSQAPDPKKTQAPATNQAPVAPAAPTQQFEGKLVKKIRDATIGDAFYMVDGDQVVVSLDDGTERTVRRRELTDVSGATGATGAPKV